MENCYLGGEIQYFFIISEFYLCKPFDILNIGTLMSYYFVHARNQHEEV